MYSSKFLRLQGDLVIPKRFSARKTSQMFSPHFLHLRVCSRNDAAICVHELPTVGGDGQIFLHIFWVCRHLGKSQVMKMESRHVRQPEILYKIKADLETKFPKGSFLVTRSDVANVLKSQNFHA